jgi:hypothetical protein
MYALDSSSPPPSCLAAVSHPVIPESKRFARPLKNRLVYDY